MHCHAGTFALTPVPDRFYPDTSLELASFPKCIAAADMRISRLLSGDPDMIFWAISVASYGDQSRGMREKYG